MGYEIDFLPAGEGEQCGEAITLRFGNLFGNSTEQTVIVIDGGFKETGEKLVEHIKEYYKTDRVNLVISTHPDADHATGLEVVIDKLKVDYFWMHQPWNHTDDIARLFKDGRVTDQGVKESLRKSLDTVRGLERIAKEKDIPIIEPFVGTKDESGKVIVVGPTINFYEDLLPGFRGTPEPKKEVGILSRMYTETKETVQKVAENWGIETLDDSGETTAENNSSTIILIFVDNGCLLFTSDAGIPALVDTADRLEVAEFDFSNIIFLQVPHHGSKRNVGPTILNRILRPKLQTDKKLQTAYVSVTKESGPKHPSKKVTNAFRRRGAYVYATHGSTLRHPHNAPDRGWTTVEPLPFYPEVED